VPENDDRQDRQDSEDRAATLAWLREPAGAGEIRVYVEGGEGAEMSATTQRALEQLINELHQAEVEGYTRGIGPTIGIFGVTTSLEGSCGELRCGQNDCTTLDCGTYSSKFR
jgi:hypothetical protein